MLFKAQRTSNEIIENHCYGIVFRPSRRMYSTQAEQNRSLRMRQLQLRALQLAV
jgi:hypothetical protein